MKKQVLYIVVPCYNEAECLRETNRRLVKKINELTRSGKISKRSKIVYIDDGSKDKTWEIIQSLKEKIIGIKLNRNYGHQNALLAGLMYARKYADAIVSMDADLQDDIDAINEMVEKFLEGFEVIYGVRKDRKTDTFFKKTTAQIFYKILRFMGVDAVYNSADYRLMSKRAVEDLSNYKEANLFLRGIVPLIGLRWTTVEYSRGERFAGQSKYPLKKMLKLAWDGITSFSMKPLRLTLIIGTMSFVISLIVLAYSITQYFIGNTVSGWTFIVCSIWLVGGLQMICIGLVGEYIGKIYIETKHRPRFLIEAVFLAGRRKK